MHSEPDAEPPVSAARFAVSLAEFSGPFDLLLSLIAKHKLEVTELALHIVTDDYLTYLRAQGATWNLDETTEFVLIAATLLDLKAARLLPRGEVEDDDDLDLLEARDLLFARLLQYQAFKSVSLDLAALMAAAARRVPRSVALEPEFAALLPEVVMGLGPRAFSELAAEVFTPAPPPKVSVAHIHAPTVSVREEAIAVVSHLRARGSATFRALVADAYGTPVVVARFLALLELYREGVVAFVQAGGLAELRIRWIGEEQAQLDVSQFDEHDFDPRGVGDGDGADRRTQGVST